MLAQSQGLSGNDLRDFTVNQFSKAVLKPDSNALFSSYCLCMYDLLIYPRVVGYPKGFLLTYTTSRLGNLVDESFCLF